MKTLCGRGRGICWLAEQPLAPAGGYGSCLLFFLLKLTGWPSLLLCVCGVAGNYSMKAFPGFRSQAKRSARGGLIPEPGRKAVITYGWFLIVLVNVLDAISWHVYNFFINPLAGLFSWTVLITIEYERSKILRLVFSALLCFSNTSVNFTCSARRSFILSIPNFLEMEK